MRQGPFFPDVSKSQAKAEEDLLIKQQLKNALRSYNGSGPLDIGLFIPEEIALLNGLTLPPHLVGGRLLNNTPGDIKEVKAYAMAQGLKRLKSLQAWFSKTLPNNSLTCFHYNSYETARVQLDESSAKTLLKIFSSPDAENEVDLIAEALNNYTTGPLYIEVLPPPQMAMINYLVNYLGIFKRHPAILQVIEPAIQTISSKIFSIINEADLPKGSLGYVFGYVLLAGQQVPQFRDQYLTNIRQGGSREFLQLEQ